MQPRLHAKDERFAPEPPFSPAKEDGHNRTGTEVHGRRNKALHLQRGISRGSSGGHGQFPGEGVDSNIDDQNLPITLSKSRSRGDAGKVG